MHSIIDATTGSGRYRATWWRNLAIMYTVNALITPDTREVAPLWMLSDVRARAAVHGKPPASPQKTLATPTPSTSAWGSNGCPARRSASAPLSSASNSTSIITADEPLSRAKKPAEVASSSLGRANPPEPINGKRSSMSSSGKAPSASRSSRDCDMTALPSSSGLCSTTHPKSIPRQANATNHGYRGRHRFSSTSPTKPVSVSMVWKGSAYGKCRMNSPMLL
mmetsp:Transcript_6795/g.20189  ORF Transcript_6795/g.20189 Transcript_6795/m.20189 type:complete len:222 (+) Transcript_6795:283-948(+)